MHEHKHLEKQHFPVATTAQPLVAF
jgi:hypothetical protein